MLTDDANAPSAAASPQLTEVQAQLNELSQQLSTLTIQLSQWSSLPERVSQIEGQLSLVSDILHFGRLRSHLEAGNWFEADRETIRAIVDVSGKLDLESISPNDIRNFPCNALQVIDQLWSQYSGDRFGFSVQLRIYQEVGGNLEATVAQNTQLVEQWGERMGWHTGDRWRRCDELDYSLSAPEGCHPSRWWNSPYGSKMTNYFLARLLSCQL
jgi:hypothetical protein